MENKRGGTAGEGGNVKNVRPVNSQTSFSMTPSADPTPASATKYISFGLKRHGEN